MPLRPPRVGKRLPSCSRHATVYVNGRCADCAREDAVRAAKAAPT